MIGGKRNAPRRPLVIDLRGQSVVWAHQQMAEVNPGDIVEVRLSDTGRTIFVRTRPTSIPRVPRRRAEA